MKHSVAFYKLNNTLQSFIGFIKFYDNSLEYKLPIS